VNPIAALDRQARRHGYQTWLEAQTLPNSNPRRGELSAVGLIKPGADHPAFICAFVGGMKGDDYRDAIDECLDWLEASHA
jgi:hypothetical protein